ncbi:MAG TPA: CsbD family protein [Ktedonobacteraceae bacterium]|jgi:uncharacterized protein YjbJ (UPF0337 family)
MSKPYSNNEPRKDMRAKGSKDTLKGKLKDVSGKVQRKVGGVMGNREMEAKGAARQTEGKAQKTVGKGERKLGKALNPDRNG